MPTTAPIGKRRPYYVVGRAKVSAHEEYIRYHDESTVIGGSLPFSFEIFTSGDKGTVVGQSYLGDSLDSYGRFDAGSVTGVSSISATDIKEFPPDSATITTSGVPSGTDVLLTIDSFTVATSSSIISVDLQSSTVDALFMAEAPSLLSTDSQQSVLYTVTSTGVPSATDVQASTFSSTAIGSSAPSHTGLYESTEATTVSSSSSASAVDNQFSNVTNIIVASSSVQTAADTLNGVESSTAIGFAFAAQEEAQVGIVLNHADISAVENYNTQNNALEPMIAHAVMFAIELPFYDQDTIVGHSAISYADAYGRVDSGTAAGHAVLSSSDISAFLDAGTAFGSFDSDTGESGDFVDSSTAIGHPFIIGSVDIEDYDRGIYEYSHYDGSAAPGVDAARIVGRSAVSALETYQTGTPDTIPGPHVAFTESYNGSSDVRTAQLMGTTVLSFQEWFNNQLVIGHSNIITAQEIYSTVSSPVSTPTSYGPTISISPVAGTSGNYIVKSDGKIYDSTGTLVSLTNKQFLSDVLIASDAAGTRRNLNVGLFAGMQMAGGRLTLRELNFNDPVSNFESIGSSSSIALLMQGCAGTLGHFRVVNFAHSGIQIENAPSGLKSGSIAASWPTSAPDLKLYNLTSHGAAGNDGSALIVKASRNTVISGFDPGTQSTPIGLSGPSTSAAIVFDGVSLTDIQDVYIDTAPDTTVSKLASKSNTYTFWAGLMKRSGIKSALFTNTSGSRPEKPIYFGLTNGILPGSETSVNCTNDRVLAEHLVLQNALAENLVNSTARDGSTKLQDFEITPTVYDPAGSLTLWTPSDISDVWPNGIKRFIHVNGVKGPLQARPSTMATVPAGGALINKSVIDNSWTHMGGIAADGITEIVGRLFDFDLMAPGSGSTLRTAVAKGGGGQLAVAADTFQASGTAVTLNSTTGKTLVVRKPDTTDPDFSGWKDVSTTISAATSATPNVVTVPTQGWVTNDTVAIVETNGTYTELQVTKVTNTQFSLQGTSGSGTHWVGARIIRMGDNYAIYSGYFDPAKPNEVETGIPYRRGLNYVGIDAPNKAFLGVKLIPRPSTTPGANPAPGGLWLPGLLPGGKILRIIAGVAETEEPHGMPTGDQTDVATTALTGSNFTITRVDDFRFLINGQTGVTWNVAGQFGTYTPKTAHAYGLAGTDNSIVFAAGITLDDAQNTNMGQPSNNIIVNVAANAHVRFVRCRFGDISLQATDATSIIDLVDCDHPVTPIPGKYDYDGPSKLGVAGTYDAANQHISSRTLGPTNVIVPAGALWHIDRMVSTNSHGDFCQGTFANGSYYNHVHIEHGRDIAAPSAGGSNNRNGIPGIHSKVAPGPHGDIQQWYDKLMALIKASVLATSAHSDVFSRFENNFQIDSPFTATKPGAAIPIDRSVQMTNTAGKIVLTWPLGPDDTQIKHGMNTDDTMIITGSSDASVNDREFFFVKTNDTVGTIGAPVLGGAAPTFSTGGTCTIIHTVHIVIPGIYRSDILTSKLVDTSDITRLSPVASQGNVSISTRVTNLPRGAYPTSAPANATRALINNLITGQLTYTAIIRDCRVQTSGGTGTWLMTTPLTPGDLDLGSPNRNAWVNFGDGISTAIPSGTATPTLG